MEIIRQPTFAEPGNSKQYESEPLVIHRHEFEELPSALIVLVHGLGGRRYGEKATWGRIPEFLFEDFPMLDVGLYEYRTLFRRFKFWESIDLQQEAEVLSGVLREADDYDRIILSGHSMGGLLCMGAMCHLFTSNQPDQLKRIAGLLLMATPQTGSQRVPRPLTWFSKDFYALRPHGPFVQDIQRILANAFHLDENLSSPNKKTVPTWAVLGSSDFWVNKFSAVGALPEERCFPARGSHTSIVKPKKAESDSYRFIRKRIAICLSRVELETTGVPSDRIEDESIALDPCPAAGIMYDRKEALQTADEFFADPKRKVLLLHGFPGIGKTTLIANVIERYGDSFAGVFWKDCRLDQSTADLLFAHLNRYLTEYGETALQDIWNDPRPAALDNKISALIHALDRHAYLLVLDNFHLWLDSGFRIRDSAIRRLLQKISSTVHKAKILLISDHRGGLNDLFANLPTGTTVEEELLGIDGDDARKLLEECGLRVDDSEQLTTIVEYFSGNPGMLRIFGRLVANRHGDPISALTTFASAEPLTALLRDASSDLTENSRSALSQLSVFRVAPTQNELGDLAIDFESDCLPLVDRFLVALVDDTALLTVSPVIRDLVTQEIPPKTLPGLHRAAAEFFANRPLPDEPKSLNYIRPTLEEVYHRLQCGQETRAIEVLLPVLPSLLNLGYVDLAEQELETLEQRLPEMIAQHTQAIRALIHGRIHDMRGKYSEALKYFQTCARESEQAEDYKTLAEALYRIGKVWNAQSRFVLAEENFERCIRICDEHELAFPQASAQLSLAWSRRIRGAADQEIREAYENSLERAQVTGDLKTLVSAHRQLGFHLWDKFKEKDAASKHYTEALKIAKAQGFAKELGAVYSELGFFYDAWGETGKAEVECMRALDISRQIGDRYLRASANCNLAKVFETQEEWVDAIRTYEQSIEGFEETQNPSGEAYARLRLGSLLGRHHNSDGARINLSVALDLCEKNDLAELLGPVREEIEKIDRLAEVGQDDR